MTSLHCFVFGTNALLSETMPWGGTISRGSLRLLFGIVGESEGIVIMAIGRGH